MTTSASPILGVRFCVYGARDLSVPHAARNVARILPVRLEAHVGALRGTYFRWSDEHGADVLVQANVADEDGLLVEVSHPAHTALVYATGLDDAGYAALGRVEGLELLDADLVRVD